MAVYRAGAFLWGVRRLWAPSRQDGIRAVRNFISLSNNHVLLDRLENIRDQTGTGLRRFDHVRGLSITECAEAKLPGLP